MNDNNNDNDNKYTKSVEGTKITLTFPLHCIQYEKYHMVSDRDEHCMKVFDRNGNFLYKFGKKGEGEGEFNDPRFL